MNNIVIVGAGLGGLTTAALLAREGLDVTVLEAHVYPGGCAGTFYYQGYRFDAGATLAGGFHPEGPMTQLGNTLGIRWPAHKTNPAMAVHFPDGNSISRYSDHRRWNERQRVFGPASENFWRWQEDTADAIWDLAERNPLWPPQRPAEFLSLLKTGFDWAAADPSRINRNLLQSALMPLRNRLKDLPENLRHFLDGQLLISAQTTSRDTNALYAAAALDLPRRGVVHLDGGMGTIADQLVKSIKLFGGRVLYRKEVTRLLLMNDRPVGVETKNGDPFLADQVIFNLPPWNIAKIFGSSAPAKLRRLPEKPRDGWGAFTVHLGIQDGSFLDDLPLHHQILNGESVETGGAVFLSISPSGDLNRAPLGARAITISTHTDLDSWWSLYNHDRDGYKTRKQEITNRIFDDIERVIPGLRDSAELILPGTPVTFERFTHRRWGWVGGFPQKNLFRSWGPRIRPGVWMVGDSIFPGQSTAAVALGGMRVSEQILNDAGRKRQKPVTSWPESEGPYAYQPISVSRKQRN